MANEVIINVKAKDDASKQMATVGGNAKKMGALAKTGWAIAGAAIIKFTGDSVAAARESNKVMAQTGAVIKSTGGIANVTAKQVDALATAISNKTGIDDEAIASGENMLLTFTKVRNEAGKGNDVFNQATMAATNMSVALGKDLTSSAMLVGKALNDPIKGMTAMTRAGIQFTDQQKKQIEKMVESGDILGAQKIILKELETQFGGSAEAAATWADKARVAAENVQEAFGQKLVPHLERFSEWFVDEGVPALEDFGDELSTLGGHLEDAAGLFEGFGSAQEATIGDMVGRFGELNHEIVAWKARYLNAYASVLEAAAKFNPAMRDNAKAVRAMANEANAELDTVKAKWYKNQQEMKNRPIVAKAKADIKELEAKVRTAKQRLRETNNQKTQARIKGEISDLRAKIAAARGALNALNGKTVFTWIKTIHTTQKGPGSAGRRAAGGNIGAEGWSHAAEGGPRGNQTLVGEHGPEIVDLPLGSHVNSNPDTQRMMATQGGSGGNTHFHFHGPVYGDHNALRRALVNMKRSGQLDVVLR